MRSAVRLGRELGLYRQTTIERRLTDEEPFMQMLRNAPLIRSDSGVVQPVRPPVYFGRLVLHPMERR
jgi:hypothetical protein